MTPEERIAEHEALVAQQREQITVLLTRIQDLEGRLAKDRHHQPPRRAMGCSGGPAANGARAGARRAGS
jgi:hypothetical protein